MNAGNKHFLKTSPPRFRRTKKAPPKRCPHIFVVFLVVLQQLEGNIIYPKVVGSSMGLPAIWVLAAVTIGGGVFGIMGMFIGVPIAATAYRILSNDVNGKTEAEIIKALEE